MAANLAGIGRERISRTALPIVAALVAAHLIVTYIPALSLWLPHLFGLR